jgi:prepilin-type N-terminal cleavage/methylation domain-containing protein
LELKPNQDLAFREGIAHFKMKQTLKNGFTLIELLVVISIIGILVGLSVFGLQGAREASRDSRRKADLELIRSGIEIYKSDCNTYPAGSGNPATVFGSALVGDDSNPSCDSGNTYISQVPQDPAYPGSNYLYWSDGITYEICTSEEQSQASTVTCGSSSNCGTASCNYKVVNP